MPETLPLPTLRACVASSKSLVGDDEAAAAGLDGGEVLEVVRDAVLFTHGLVLDTSAGLIFSGCPNPQTQTPSTRPDTLTNSPTSQFPIYHPT